MTIADEKYVALTTFRRTGEPVTSPVWIVPLADGRASVTTGSTTGKVKRLRHTPRGTLQPCNFRGRLRPGSHAVEGRAVVVGPDDPACAENRCGLRRKYAVLGRALEAVVTVRARLPGGKNAGATDCVVVIDLAEPPEAPQADGS